MLSVAEENEARPAESIFTPRVVGGSITIEVPLKFPKVAAAVGMAGDSRLSADLRQIVRSREHLREFVDRLDQVVTCLYPSPGAGGVLLREAIDAATRAFMTTASARVGLDGARFMAAAIAVCARGLVAYRVVLSDERAQPEEWSLLSAETLRQAIARLGLSEIRFEAQPSPDAATLWAAKSALVMRTLQFADLVLLERAGIDYRTFEFQ